MVFFPGNFNRATALGTNKVSRSRLHVRVSLGDVFGFAEHQLKAINGLGFEITMYRKIGSVISGQNAATPDRETTVHAIRWFVSPCTPDEIHQDLMND